MKSFKTKLALITTMLLVATVSFAQGPDPDNLPGDSNPTDSPIDSTIVVLIAVGLLFVTYTFFKKREWSK